MYNEKKVDSFRFINGITKRMIKNWISFEKARPIPWTSLAKPLSECTVTLLSSAGIALKTDKPFDQEGEHQNPWWGDPSYGEQDLNCLFPLRRLQEMENRGRIGRSSPRHYSIMGYLLNPEEMLCQTVPVIIRDLKEDFVDMIVLVPA